MSFKLAIRSYEDGGEMIMTFGITTEPGQKVSRVIELNLAGVTIQIPIFIIHGREDGPNLHITAGIHGTEYASIEAALRLGRALTPDDIKGRVVIVPIANMPSFRRRTIYVGPYDGKNLNRVFPGKADGSFSEALAHALFQEVILQADYYLDLHGGDMIEALVPFVTYSPSHNNEVDGTSRMLAETFGVEYIAVSEIPGSTINAASRAGIPAIIAEAGGQGIWTEDTVTIHFEGVQRIMGRLGMIKRVFEERPVKTLSFPWLFSEHDGVFYPAVTIGTKVSLGQKVGSVCDYFGMEQQSVFSPTDGRVLFLVSSLAINAGDPLMGIGGYI